MSSTAAQSDPEAPYVLRQDDGPVARLTLNRPTEYNALSEAMLAALQTELDALAGDSEIRVVVLAAAGKAFCAGHHLKEMRARREQAYYEALFTTCSQVMLTLTRIPQPVIARVQGIATAAGCQLVASCDLAVAARTARFATSGINVGLFCSTPGVAISRNVPRKIAMEMLLTGKYMDADTAARHGLINHAIEADKLDTAVAALAQTIVGKSPAAIAGGKRLFYEQLDRPLADAYAHAGAAMACHVMADDAAEGIDAFIGKRQPVWRGR